MAYYIYLYETDSKRPTISLSKSASSYLLDGVRRSVENHYFVYD